VFLGTEKAAEKVGSHRVHIGRLERGEVANPRMTTIRKLARALKVDPAELVQ
jgi:transcriptional regulator with XRE-family HTH domain